MSVEVAFQQMVILFFGILLGFIAVKTKIIDQQGNKALSSLVMNVILPFFIIVSGATSSYTVTGLEVALYFGISLVCYAAAYFLGTLLSWLPIVPRDERRIYRFMTTFGNTGFIGLPVVGALFGSDAVLYATIFNLPFNLLVFSIGIVLVSSDAKFKAIKPRMIFNNCLIASILAILISLFGIKFPPIVLDGMSEIGMATVPIAMIITGVSLGQESFKDVFGRLSLYLVTFVKVGIVPLITFFILSLVYTDPLMIRVGTVLMAMPVATNATLLSIQYGGPDRTASRGVFLSTLFAVVTIPLLVLLMG